MPDLHLELPDLSYVDLHGWHQPFQQSGVGVGIGIGRGPQSRDQLDNGYDQARKLIERNQYERAIEVLDRVISGNGSQAPGAMYWKAYSLARVDRRPEALTTLDELRKQFPKSAWIKDAQALEVEVRQASGQSVSADAQSDDELKLLALRGLMQSDPESALPVIEKMLNGSSSVRVKDRALFVVSQSRSTQGTRADRGLRQGQRQPRSAAEGDPLHRPDGRSRGVAGAGRGLPRHQRRARQARDHPRAGQRQRPRAPAGPGQERDVGGTARRRGAGSWAT